VMVWLAVHGAGVVFPAGQTLMLPKLMAWAEAGVLADAKATSKMKALKAKRSKKALGGAGQVLADVRAGVFGIFGLVTGLAPEEWTLNAVGKLETLAPSASGEANVTLEQNQSRCIRRISTG